MLIKSFKKAKNLLLLSKRRFFHRRKSIKNVKATIISSNCVGGAIYKDFKMPFSSPTIGLFICGPDFVKLCTELSYYLSIKPKEIYVSKWFGVCDHPVGVIGDIEIHFLHYKDFRTAFDSWEKRKKRVDLDNVFFILTDRDFTSYQDMVDFDRLTAKNKVVLSSSYHENIECLVHCEKYEKFSEVGMIPLYMEYTDYFDVVDFVDKGCDFD